MQSGSDAFAQKLALLLPSPQHAWSDLSRVRLSSADANEYPIRLDCTGMTKVQTLTGHTYRVLYLAMSPDGQTVVTGAGDETLRFWNVFGHESKKKGSEMNSGTSGLVGKQSGSLRIR